MIISILVLLSFILSACGTVESDEYVIRKELNVPDSVQLVSLDTFPKESGWFGREGLKIDAVFQFSDKEFNDYLLRAENSGEWLELPIPKDFLMKMLRIQNSKRGIINTYKEQNRPLPEEGTVYNPTEEQLFEERVKIIPAHGSNGIFTLKSAGNDIMRMPKKTYTRLDKEINDFMLGILDFDRKQLIVKVSTNY